MSAFVVSDLHINVLVSWAGRVRGSIQRSYYWQGRRIPFAGDESRVAQVLYDENARSVDARYRESTPPRVFPFRFEHGRAASATAVAIIKMAHCLAYQSCETDDWESTEAFAILRGIEDFAMRALPGYDEAPWELRP